MNSCLRTRTLQEAAFICLFLSAFFLSAQALRLNAADTSDPVLKLLLEKGIISQEELDRAKAEAAAIARTNAATLSEAQFALASESKWRIGEAFKNVELFGDVRLRYENRQAYDPGDGRIELNRGRVSVR